MASENIDSRVGFLSDDPIENSNQDLLRRIKFAKTLVDQMCSIHQPKCLVIGIHGPWGSGKSSVLNLINNEIKKDDENIFTVVRFNPWNFTTIDQLILMFFRELNIALNKNNQSDLAKDIGNTLEIFGNLLSPISILPGGQGLDLVSKFLNKLGKIIKDSKREDDLLNLKIKLNNLFDKYGKKIIILIDDIDRLDNESMRLMFRLIRLNADFHNTIYLLAFDKQIVEKVFDSEEGISGHEYLEKIIQVSFDLPITEPTSISKFLFVEMNNIFGEIPQDDWDQNRWGNLYHSGFKLFFKNIRDVKRYVNSLSLTFSQVNEEVNPVDFAGLEVLRVFCPEVYRGLAKEKKLLIYTDGIYGRVQATDIEAEKQELEKIFSKAGEDYITATREICFQLFPQLARIYKNTHYSNEWQSTWRKEKRICSHDIFDKYFLLGVPEGEISEVEIRLALENAGDKKVFADILRDFNKSGIILRFLERLEDFIQEFPEDKIQSTIEALIDIGDEIPIERSGIFDISSDDQIMRIIYHLLKKLENSSKRVEILKNVVQEGSGLYSAVYLVSTLQPDDEREEESIISDSEYQEIRDIALEKIRQAAKQESLSKTPNLAYVLYQWRDWATVNEPKEYVSHLTSSNEGVISFLVGILSTTFSHTFGEYVSRKNLVINSETILEFSNIQYLEPKIQEIKENQWTSLSDIEKIALDASIKHRFSSSVYVS